MKRNWNVLIGAAFLMATSAIGPGFLTQTAVFTAQLGASFGFVILLSIILDIVAQLNIWRVIIVAKKPAQQIANQAIPGLGYAVAILVFIGGLAFNIGNLAGAGLGLNVLFGTDVSYGVLISAIISIAIFIYKEAGKVMDFFTKMLGLVMIILMSYVAYTSSPPLSEALFRSVVPSKFSFEAVLTIVGGTVGGYITFSGAHRLLDANVLGKENLGAVNRGALSAIGIASLMRILLFLAALGVISKGNILDFQNPPASVFRLASGQIGYKLFGLVMWSAAISSVIGSAYTSVSFIKTFHPFINRNNQVIIIIFILISCVSYLAVGQPIKTLIFVGALNGLILPISLGAMIFAAYKRNIVGDYKQPLSLTIAAIVVIILMTWMGLEAIAALMTF